MGSLTFSKEYCKLISPFLFSRAAGMFPASAETLLHYALTTTREVLDIQSKFMIGVIQQYEKIRSKNNITWTNPFENTLMNSQSVIDCDRDEIQDRLVGNAIGYTDPPGMETYDPYLSIVE